MTKERFDRVKMIIQREIKTENLSNFEYNLLDSFLGEVRRNQVHEIPKVPKINCAAKHRANDEPTLELCNCHNFCKFDGAQFDTSLA